MMKLMIFVHALIYILLVANFIYEMFLKDE